ncbi:MAG: tetratricopeptide repeat protein [Gammaproteobacteria bacterium]
MSDNEIARLTEQAQAHLEANNLDAARALYSRICGLDKDNAEAWLTFGAISGQGGLVGDAIPLVRRSLELDPKNPAAYLALAQLLLTNNDPEGALSEARKAVTVDPESADAWSFLGALTGQLGKLDEAEKCCRRALALEPALADARINLAYALHRVGRLQEAEVAYQEGLELRPDLGQLHADLGNLLIRLGRYDAAITRLESALLLSSDYGPAYMNLGVARARQGDLAAASVALKEAVRLMPSAAEPWFHLGLLREDLADPAGAVAAYRRALALDPGSLVSCFRMGGVFTSEGRWDEALDAYRKVLEISPGAAEGFAGQAEVYRNLGEYGRADSLLRSCLGSGEINVRVALVFSRLCDPAGECGDALRYLEYVSTTPHIDDSDRADTFFALGRLRDRLGHYDQAFGAYVDANRLKRRRYHRKQYIDRVDALIRTFDPQVIDGIAARRDATERPILLVGMPFSGTEILERMLARHPAVSAGGEPAWLPDVFEGHIRAAVGSDPLAPEGVVKIGPADIAQAAEEYRTRLSWDTTTVTDRATQNIEYIGLIHKMFPHARIIHCVRDPVDVCFSCYTHNFSAYHPYVFDLEDVGERFRQYERLMRHWVKTVGVPVLQVRYEELVAAPEQQFGVVLSHCGLESGERCLEPLKAICDHERSNALPDSLAGYTGPAGRWKHYERYLGPLLASLGLPNGSLH